MVRHVALCETVVVECVERVYCTYALTELEEYADSKAILRESRLESEALALQREVLGPKHEKAKLTSTVRNKN